MATWAEFCCAAPSLAGHVRALLEQYASPARPGQGFGYLATVRPDGGPRVHPVAPVVADGALFCFLMPSPKRRDLLRDGRYALHSFPCEDSDDEAYLSGVATPVADPVRAREIAARCHAAEEVDWQLFTLGVEAAMVGRPGVPGRAGPSYRVWRAPARSVPQPPLPGLAPLPVTPACAPRRRVSMMAPYTRV